MSEESRLFLLPYKFEGGRIDTIALDGSRRPIIKNMPQIGIALGANHLYPPQARAVIFRPFDIQLANGPIVARPAGAGMKFVRSPKPIHLSDTDIA